MSNTPPCTGMPCMLGRSCRVSADAVTASIQARLRSGGPKLAKHGNMATRNLGPDADLIASQLTTVVPDHGPGNGAGSQEGPRLGEQRGGQAQPHCRPP